MKKKVEIRSHTKEEEAKRGSFATDNGDKSDHIEGTMGSHPSHGGRFTTHQNMSRKSTTGEMLFKVILLGDTKVGKSSIIMRLVVRMHPHN